MRLLHGLLIFVVTLCLILTTYSTVIHRNFQDVPHMLNFLDRSGAYNNLSNIIKLEVQDQYPPIIQNNILLGALANKTLEAVVTPGLVAKVAQPALRASTAFAKAPTDIVDQQVVVETAPYKAQAVDAISQLGLPGFITKNSGLLFAAIPAQLTIVNLKNHPNSVLAGIIKIRDLLHYNNQLLLISRIVLILSLLILVLSNLHQLRRLCRFLAWSFGLAGAIIYLKYLLLPWFLSFMVPVNSNPIINAQNQLINDSLIYLFRQISQYGLGYLGISLALVLLLRFTKLDRAQTRLNRFLLKIHFPTVSVKIQT